MNITIKLLLFIIPFIPLIVTDFFFYPFIAGKNFVFRIVVELALVLWLVSGSKIKNSKILWSVLSFIFVVGVANILGANPLNSFWSDYERMDGYVTLLHLGAYFLILRSVLQTKKEWLNFFRLFVLGGVAVIGFVFYKEGLSYSSAGTINNPSYFAAYLLLIIFLSFILLVNVKEKLRKTIYIASIGLSLFMIYFTSARATILALLVGFILFIMTRHKIKNIVLGLVIAVLLLVSFGVFRNNNFIIQNPVLSRFRITEMDKSKDFRLITWDIAWQGIKEKPVLGWGQENFGIVYAKYYDSRLFTIEGWADRAHNIVLDWLINAGFIGLGFYLLIFGAVYWKLKTPKGKWIPLMSGLEKSDGKTLGNLEFGSIYNPNCLARNESMVLKIGFAVYFFQNLFVFDTIITYMIFFALLAYVDKEIEEMPQGEWLVGNES